MRTLRVAGAARDAQQRVPRDEQLLGDGGPHAARCACDDVKMLGHKGQKGQKGQGSRVKGQVKRR